MPSGGGSQNARVPGWDTHHEALPDRMVGKALKAANWECSGGKAVRHGWETQKQPWVFQIIRPSRILIPEKLTR